MVRYAEFNVVMGGLGLFHNLGNIHPDMTSRSNKKREDDDFFYPFPGQLINFTFQERLCKLNKGKRQRFN